MEPASPTPASPVQEPFFDQCLFTKVAEWVPSPTAKTFLDLPPELRLKIYEYMVPGYLYDDDFRPKPGARVVPSIALALTCRQICHEYLAIAVAAQQVYREGFQARKAMPVSGTHSLDIYICLDLTGARVVEIVGIDIVDRFGYIEIYPSPGCEFYVWSREGDWSDHQVRHQIALAGGPLAFGWRGDSDAFYRRAIFEKTMERADFFLKYGGSDELPTACQQRPDLFPKHVHCSTWVPDDRESPEEFAKSIRDHRALCGECRQHELRPITFKFTSAAKHIDNNEVEAVAGGSETSASHDEVSGSNADD